MTPPEDPTLPVAYLTTARLGEKGQLTLPKPTVTPWRSTPGPPSPSCSGQRAAAHPRRCAVPCALRPVGRHLRPPRGAGRGDSGDVTGRAGPGLCRHYPALADRRPARPRPPQP